MAYEKLNLQDGQVLDAAALAHMEEGISSSVQYIEQALTEEQQMQARKNLGLYYSEPNKLYFTPEQTVNFEYDEEKQVSSAVLQVDMSVLGQLTEPPSSAVVVIDGIEHDLTYNGDGSYGNLGLINSGSAEGADVLLDAFTGTVLCRGEKTTCIVACYFDIPSASEIPSQFIPAGVKREIVMINTGTTTFAQKDELGIDKCVVVDNDAPYIVLGTVVTASTTGGTYVEFSAISPSGAYGQLTISYDGDTDTSVVSSVTFQKQALPYVTANDNGKIMAVVNGEWQLVSLSELT